MISQFLPIVSWGKEYNRSVFGADLIAALIVTIMLIPQSLAYALLAGVPAEVGLYSSILPLITYAVFGTSRTLSVGPVAITSLMTAAALSGVVEQGSADYLTAAIVLALLSGLFLITMGAFKAGFLANFLSHPVVSGFITASAVIIALSQLRHLLGVNTQGDNLASLSASLFLALPDINVITLGLGLCSLIFLFWVKEGGVRFLASFGLSPKSAQLISKAAPVLVVIVTITVTSLFALDTFGVAIVGTIPKGLPLFQIPVMPIELVKSLIGPAILISVIGYVESVSVGKTLAAKKRQKIDPDQELIGLGTANIASALSGGFPVTGGFSRSVVNFDAGAVTQAASIYAAIGIGAVSLFFTPWLYFLPKATLAATIIVAVVSLVDFSIFKKTWVYEKSDFYAVMITVGTTLFFGVEIGVTCGVCVSLALHLHHSSKPHIAVVGLVEGTEHFRNVRRFHVQTIPEILSLRVDGSLFFANAGFLEDYVYDAVFMNDRVAHVILMCSAINEIDYSALEVLESINERLIQQGVNFHLSEVKGPVEDVLKRSGLLSHLSGKVHISQYHAYRDTRELLGINKK